MYRVRAYTRDVYEYRVPLSPLDADSDTGLGTGGLCLTRGRWDSRYLACAVAK